MKTQTIRLKENSKAAVQKAARELKKGNVIIIPTETSYGLCALAGNKKAVQKIHDIKKQPRSKAVSIIVPGLLAAKKYGHISRQAKMLSEKFMPGPLTLVVPAKKNAAHLGQKTIAFRISSHHFAGALCAKLKGAVTATSANLHGHPDNYSGKKAAEIFEGKVTLVVDAGVLPKRKPSTVYDVEKRLVLRQGKITEKQINRVIKKSN